MSRPTVKFFDAITEEEIIREMNDEEYEIHLRDLERIEQEKVAFEAVEAKKQTAIEKLNSLGLSIEDLKAIGLG